MKDMRRETARTTLFVCSVPKTATEEAIKTHFTEAYPTCRVSAVTLGYDVAKLMHLDKERIRAGKNMRYYERVLEKTGEREMINLQLCGHLCCCSNCEKVDAIEYYRAKEKELLEEVREQVELVPQRPLGIAFITLQTEAMAQYILKDFNALKCGSKSCCGREPQPSSNTETLKVKKWTVSFAPHPKNVYWDNLSTQGFSWFMRYVMLNFFLFFLLTFLTTPTIIINTIDKFNVTKPIYYLNSAIISQFFPTFLLWVFSALLPTIVYYSTLGEAHWTRSSEQLSMLRKLYFFLLFMVLILPSLGLTSLAVFFRWLFDKEFLSGGKLRCVFLPDQGAFFVNYVIAAGLVGSGMDLLRLPGLLLYTIRMALAQSAAERKYVKQNQAYEFEYGAMYGWTLCVFTVIMAYSIICPIIVPFGLLYMMLKHLVDKHNLYFAYLPARLDHQVHLGAVNQALAAPLICLIWLYFFSVLRSGFWAAISLFTLVVLTITVFICISYTCFGHLKYLSPHNYEVKEDDDHTPEGSEENTLVYLPRVLNPKSPASTTQASDLQQSYGTTTGSPTYSSSPVEGSMISAVATLVAQEGRGEDEMKDKKNLYSFNCMDWFLLPPATHSMIEDVSKAAKGRFIGDPSYVYEHLEIQRQGEEDEAVEEEVVTKVNEEKRLAVTVHWIDEEVSVVPRSAFIKSPHGLVQMNRSFGGLSHSEAGKLNNFLHFTESKNLKKKSILEMADLNPTIDFLDVLSDDIPKGSWSLQSECAGQVCVIRSLLWLGLTFYHVPMTPQHGYIYIGDGTKNLDLPFML
ncbi:hypothetical protein PAMP_014293 [Pampus punctatissimus]